MPNLTADDYDHCPRCQSLNLIRQTGDAEPTKHYGRLKCGDCGKHIQWLKDPSLSLESVARNSAIRSILKNYKNELNEWELTFLKAIHNKRFLTDNQKIKLNQIGFKTLDVQICVVSSPIPVEKKKTLHKCIELQ